jgi:hypothetical protein
MLIFSVLLGMGYLIFQRTFKNMERQKQALDTLHEARRFLALIEKDLRQMTQLVSLDTVFKEDVFHDQNALFYNLVIEVPNRQGTGMMKVTYTYEGPDAYKEDKGRPKIVYRQEEGQVRQPVITKQMNFLKVWGTDGVIFRNRGVGESMDQYKSYLRPHYYHPTNPGADGLRDLGKVKGIEVQLSMNELFDPTGKPIKTRTFVTRIYSRVLNAKYE